MVTPINRKRDLTPSPYEQDEPNQTPLTYTPAPREDLKQQTIGTPEVKTQSLVSENIPQNAPKQAGPRISAPDTGERPENIGPLGVEITSGGKLATLKSQGSSDLSLASQSQIIDAQRQAQRQRDIAVAFDYALSNPLPSSFSPQGIDPNGVLRAAGNAALGTGATAGTGAILGAVAAGAGTGAAAGSVVPGVGTAIGAVIGAASAITLSAVKGGLNEIRNQKADTIQLAVKNYDRAEQLRLELIRAANQGADPYELIEAYKQVEQAKVTSREALEYAARRDPSGFSDKARGQLNAMKQQETPQMRYIRNQRFLKSLQNPKGELAPEVPEQAALIS
jgi:hypothetical protein